MDSASPLLTLPLEILHLIIEHTHASAHWPLAQTCKHIYLNSQPILKRHHKAHCTFRITCDLDPLTVPNLLWSVFSHGAASIDAWHVREFEVWGDRLCGNTDLSEEDAETGELSAAEGSFPPGDIDYFCDNLLEIPEYLPDTFFDEAREELQKGGDVLLKSTLLAHLPRLRALRYARVDGVEHVSLKYLCGFIPHCLAAETLLPGFKALERVAVGISIDEGSPPAAEPSKRGPEELLALLCLPNLLEVYFAHLDGDFSLSEQFTELYPFNTEPPFDKTSPVQTIILDQLETDLSEQLMEFLARTPHSLQNLIISLHTNNDQRGEYPQRTHTLVHKLSEHQHLSLHWLHLSSYDDNWNQWLMSAMKPDQIIQFEDLRMVDLYWEWMEASLDRAGAVQSRSELLERLFRFMKYNLPATMEIVLFEGFAQEDGIFQTGEFGDPSLQYIDEAVEAMITSPRYQNLKAIFLNSLRESLSYINNVENDNLQFPKTRKAAKERGVLLDLQPSDSPPFFMDYFPKVPTNNDMVTGLDVEEVGNLVIPGGSP